MTFQEIPTNYAPSGEYICAPTLLSTVSIANPFYLRDSPLSIDDVGIGRQGDLLQEKMREDRDAVFVTKSALRSYSDRIVGIARHFKEKDYGLVLCPLRGGRMPSVQVATMCEASDKFAAFDYADGAQGQNDKRIINDLLGILDPLGREDLRQVAVLDAAKGGNGATELSRILYDDVFPELGGQWECDFHLLYADDRDPPSTSRVYGHRTKAISFDVQHHPVSSLLVEDQEALLGYKIVRDENGSQVHPLRAEGQLVVVDENEATVYAKNPLDQVVIGAVGGEIKEALDRLNDARLNDPSYWHRFLSPDPPVAPTESPLVPAKDGKKRKSKKR